MQTENFHGKAEGIAKRLLSGLGTDISRPAFFKVLAEELSAVFKFDRLVINLYDSDGGMLSYFTSAEGAVVSSLSPVRPADASNTVAGRAIAGRKPVIITDLARCFPEAVPHPLMEAGLTTTMAFPLMLNNRVFATLHCSFLKQPSELYAITNFLTELCPAIAVCLGAIPFPFPPRPFPGGSRRSGKDGKAAGEAQARSLMPLSSIRVRPCGPSCGAWTPWPGSMFPS